MTGMNCASFLRSVAGEATMPSLTTQPISWDRLAYAERQTAQTPCGALVMFVGVVRGDRRGTRRVQALRYEAYPEMAEAQIDQLVVEAKARWMLDEVRILHRLGRVDIGQISVVVMVTAQHRDEAYAASRFLIEQIKHRVPIWKREQYHDGTSEWVSCREGASSTLEPGDLHAHV